MTSNRPTAVLAREVRAEAYAQELAFAGDGVQLAGQIEYPRLPSPANGFPLLFLLHHATSTSRADYADYADLALSQGYAVFRWDKRGTGRSGNAGRGSTTQDAVDAYEVALEQAHINRRRAVIGAIGAGTALLGSAFGLFARIQRPHAVLLVANMLDETAICAIDAPVQIVSGEDDWNTPARFAVAAAHAHAKAYAYGAQAYIAPQVGRFLMSAHQTLDIGARKVIGDWLQQIQHTPLRSQYI